MASKKPDFSNARSGTAISIVFKVSKGRAGWGKRQKSGVVEFLVPEGRESKERDQLLRDEISRLLHISNDKIEIVISSKDKAIVSIYDLRPTEVEKVFSSILY